MSYINKALRKLQEEKKTRYMIYDHIVSAPGKKSEPLNKWLSVIGISIVFFFAAGMIALFYGIGSNKVTPMDKISTQPVTSTVARPVVTQFGTNKDTKVEPKLQKTIAKIRTKQEIAESKTFFAQALDLQREGKLEEAKKLYRKVVEIDPQNAQAFNNLGVIYMSEKNYRRAIMRFNNALDIKHDYVDAHYNLACLYAKKNDVPQSLFYLKNAIEFNPEAKKWAKNDSDLETVANLPEFKKLVEKQ